jgi:lipopolysaccharide biosynthesis protein
LINKILKPDILNLLNDRIVPGTVIVFDEMYPWNDLEQYDLWEQGEFQALGEWLRNHQRAFRPLYRNEHQQCSIEVIS